MNKIKIDKKLYNKLNDLCESLKLETESKTDSTAAECLKEVYRVGSIMTDEAQTLIDAVDDALADLYNRNFEIAIEELSTGVKEISNLRESLDMITANLSNGLNLLRDLLEPNGWTLTCTADEIQEAIDKGFSLTDSMALGYKDGEFALLFDKSEEDGTLVCPPFIIATGDQEHYEEVQKYVESFLDMEEQ